MKWTCEIIQDFDGKYYANLCIENKLVEGLPEYVNYKTLINAIKNKTGIHILKRKDIVFEKYGRKKYALIDNTQIRKDCRVTLSEIISKKYQPKWN